MWRECQAIPHFPSKKRRRTRIQLRRQRRSEPSVCVRISRGQRQGSPREKGNARGLQQSMSNSAHKQHPVAFGLPVSFLFSLLPIKDEDKKIKIKERSWAVSARPCHLFSSRRAGTRGRAHLRPCPAALSSPSHLTR